MKDLSAILSRGTSFSRIDFYEVNRKLYFGEFTLYPASGFGKFSPDIWNKKLVNGKSCAYDFTIISGIL